MKIGIPAYANTPSHPWDQGAESLSQERLPPPECKNLNGIAKSLCERFAEKGMEQSPQAFILQLCFLLLLIEAWPHIHHIMTPLLDSIGDRFLERTDVDSDAEEEY